jgi:Flp pilus assembly protein TadB
MFLINPTHMLILVNDPLGVQMISGALLLQIVGGLAIRKLVRIEY